MRLTEWEATTMAARIPRVGSADRAGRDVRLLFALGGVSTAAFLPFFVLLLRDRGLGPDVIGLVLGASALAGVLAAPVWSHVADTRLGTIRTLQLSSLAAAGAALLLIPTGANAWSTAAAAAVLGVASAPGTALSDTVALGVLGERMDRYGSIRLWASAGWAVAVVAFGWWFERAGLGRVLPAYALGMLAFTAAAMRFPSVRPEPHPSEGSRLGSVGAAFRETPRLLPFLIGLLIISTAASAGWSFVPLRIASGGGGPLLIGVSAGLAAVVEIPFFRASGWLGEHVGMRVLYVAGASIYAVMLLGWGLVSNPTAVAAIKVAGGAAFGLTYAALVVITGRLVSVRLRNTGQTLLQIFGAGIGPIVGPAVGGFVYVHLGPSSLFLIAAAGVVAGILVVWRALRPSGV
jgi:MFS family permease